MPEQSKQMQTAERLVAAFRAMDNDTIISLRAADCMRHIYPTSQGYSPQTNEQFGNLLKQLAGIFRNFSLEVLDVTEDLPQQKVMLWLRASGDTDVGPYVNEYVWRLVFDGSGEKIVEWWEFTDAGMKSFFGKLREAMQAKQRQSNHQT